MNMERLKLRQLSPDDGRDVYEMLQGIGENENSFKNPVRGMDFDEYKEWLIEQDNWSRGVGLPEGYVPQTLFWLMENDLPVGIGKIRHALTDFSREYGGNIGYAISSKHRGKGYGNTILKLLLEKAREMKIEEILLTVDKYNYASKKVIENNGGTLIKENDSRWTFIF